MLCTCRGWSEGRPKGVTENTARRGSSCVLLIAVLVEAAAYFMRARTRELALPVCGYVTFV